MSSRHSTDGSSVDLVDLQVEYESEPNNVRPSMPRFSWRAESDGRGRDQTAYRILVARTPDALSEERGDVWDSGRVESPNSTNVTYDGPDLASDTEYHWTVRIWDEDGAPSEWADPQTFATALEGHHEWEGEWIGYRPDAGDSNGYRSQWHPADQDVREWVQIDLGETRDLERIDLHPANPFNGPETPDGMAVSAVYTAQEQTHNRIRDAGPAGFGFPQRYRVEVSDDPDFEESAVLVDRTDERYDNPGADSVSFEADARGRYVRIVAVDLYEFDPSRTPNDFDAQVKTDLVREERSRWQIFALAGVTVEGSEEADLARDRPVRASSSIEEQGWGREHLVDGNRDSVTGHGSPLLRTDVELDKEVESARAHVCGLGFGELYVNGDRIGDDVLNPGWTDYDERVLYSTYDVTDRLRAGENAIGLWLGRGRFSQNARDWTGHGAPRAILQLNVEYVDGTTRSVWTDSSWRAAPSPLLENDIYDGEVYDARRERPGWAAPGFDDSDWDGASVVEAPGGDLVPQRTPPIRVTQTIEPVEVRDHEDGPIVDFGQNLVGWLEIEIEGAEPGDELELRHAEVLRDDGSLSQIDLRSADATDTYVSNGDDDVYHPRFTYHGFRYAQIVDYPGDFDLDKVRAKVVHTDVEPSGSFDCSNEDLSQVQQNAEWGLRGNLHGVLTDCPQRDERFGWTGDNHIAARALLYNFDGARFYEKWMDDHDDVQSEHGYIADTIPYGYGTIPEDRTWGITEVTVPWHLYRHYGDVGVLERHYEGMRRYLDYWHSESEDGIVGDEYGNYGDWLAFENADGRRGLPYDLFNTAFHYHTTNLFARIADVLGHEDDAEQYAARADAIAESFNQEFFDPETNQYGPGTQASYAVPLYVGLVPDERVDEMVAGLVEKVRSDGGKLQTGFLGTRPLIQTLVDHGHGDLAYQIVSQPERPGWVYMVRQGATTMWERWDSDDRIGAGMNSFNHSPFTFVSEWFYYALAGLRFDDTMHGRGSVEIAPTFVDDLDWVEGEIETVNGRLRSEWERQDGDLVLDVEVPWNTDATVRLPDGDVQLLEDERVVWDGETAETLPDGIRAVTAADGTLSVDVSSGSYRFRLSR